MRGGRRRSRWRRSKTSRRPSDYPLAPGESSHLKSVLATLSRQTERYGAGVSGPGRPLVPRARRPSMKTRHAWWASGCVGRGDGGVRGGGGRRSRGGAARSDVCGRGDAAEARRLRGSAPCRRPPSPQAAAPPATPPAPGPQAQEAERSPSQRQGLGTEWGETRRSEVHEEPFHARRERSVRAGERAL